MDKEEIKFNTDDDIIMQIEMMSYMEYNRQIATANEYIGDIYSYRDIKDMESAQEHYEKELSYQAIKQLQQQCKKQKEVIDKAICYVQENTCWELRTSKLLDILKEASE